METQGIEKRKLFLGLPIHEAVEPVFLVSIMKLLEAGPGLDGTIYPHAGDSLVCRARNSITRRFLESDCTHLLMIDSDLVFSPEQVKRIATHDVDIVGGIYLKKQEGPPQVVCNPLAQRPPATLEDGDLMQINYVGTGFICISRRVFEVMIQRFGEDMRYFLDENNKVTEYDFWRAAPYQYAGGFKRYLSEDWWFCQKAQDCGFKIWLDLKVVLPHVGHCSYPLSYQTQMLHEAQASEGNAGDAAIPSVEPALPINRIQPEMVNRLKPLQPVVT